MASVDNVLFRAGTCIMIRVVCHVRPNCPHYITSHYLTSLTSYYCFPTRLESQEDIHPWLQPLFNLVLTSGRYHQPLYPQPPIYLILLSILGGSITHLKICSQFLISETDLEKVTQELVSSHHQPQESPSGCLLRTECPHLAYKSPDLALM